MDDLDVPGLLVPMSLLLSEQRAESLRAALREAAQLCGEVRECFTCGQMLAVFSDKRKRKLIHFTVNTGNPHHQDCTPLAMHRARCHAEHVKEAWRTLVENGIVAEAIRPEHLSPDAPQRRQLDPEEIERLFIFEGGGDEP